MFTLDLSFYSLAGPIRLNLPRFGFCPISVYPMPLTYLGSLYFPPKIPHELKVREKDKPVHFGKLSVSEALSTNCLLYVKRWYNLTWSHAHYSFQFVSFLLFVFDFVYFLFWLCFTFSKYKVLFCRSTLEYPFLCVKVEHENAFKKKCYQK